MFSFRSDTPELILHTLILFIPYSGTYMNFLVFDDLRFLTKYFKRFQKSNDKLIKWLKAITYNLAAKMIYFTFDFTFTQSPYVFRVNV